MDGLGTVYYLEGASPYARIQVPPGEGDMRPCSEINEKKIRAGILARGGMTQRGQHQPTPVKSHLWQSSRTFSPIITYTLALQSSDSKGIKSTADVGMSRGGRRPNLAVKNGVPPTRQSLGQWQCRLRPCLECCHLGSVNQRQGHQMRQKFSALSSKQWMTLETCLEDNHSNPPTKLASVNCAPETSK